MTERVCPKSVPVVVKPNYYLMMETMQESIRKLKETKIYFRDAR